jgi:MFS family permease
MADVSVERSSSSPAATLVAAPQMPNWQRYLLLMLFCFAQFLDAFSNTAIFSALPKLKEKMDMDESESTWVISAFQLTFASFLLVSGRFSDIYNPSASFTCVLGVASYSPNISITRICVHFRPYRTWRWLPRQWVPEHQDSAYRPPRPQRNLYVPFILAPARILTHIFFYVQSARSRSPPR